MTCIHKLNWDQEQGFYFFLHRFVILFFDEDFINQRLAEKVSAVLSIL